MRGFSVKEYLCDTLKVVQDTKFDKTRWFRRKAGNQRFSCSDPYSPRLQEHHKVCTKDAWREISQFTEEVQEGRRIHISGRMKCKIREIKSTG